MAARNDDDAAAWGRGEVVAREGKVGDAGGHAACVFHIRDDADHFVGMLVVAEMLADGVDAAEEGAGGFLIQHQWQTCSGGSGDTGWVTVETLIALVEFTAGNEGLVEDGKEAGAYGSFAEVFLDGR